ncbi:MAG: anaerobic ribonucleoside-triphosphate reductase activating protein [Spirochaetales bacterium]|nr:anaerobic ribonucleoside-triphosphate reductase activating protein [Spirochaetales bacterium]
MEATKFGLQKVTLLDFPGKVAATIFTAGCNLRCPYCHNAELIKAKAPDNFLTKDEVFSYLNKRKNVLGGVCITGGEPLLNKNMPEIIQEIKDLGLLVKLDTNGTCPEMLKKANPDFIAMDIKSSPANYTRLLKAANGTSEKITESIKFILESGIDHEFRTTTHPAIVTKDDFIEIARLIKGTNRYVITKFKPGNILDKKFNDKIIYTEEEFEGFKELMESYNIPTLLRG